MRAKLYSGGVEDPTLIVDGPDQERAMDVLVVLWGSYLQLPDLYDQYALCYGVC